MEAADQEGREGREGGGAPSGRAYKLRHSVITDMLVGGMDSLTVSRMAGTSLAMIEKHYGHLLHDHAAKAMAGLAP